MLLMQDEAQLVLPSQFQAIGRACEFIVQQAEAAGLSDRAVFHVQLAVDEACTNIVEHAYGGSDQGKIRITCGTGQLQGKAAFIVRIEDWGISFDPENVPAPNLSSDPNQLKIGGLGIHFMRQMMDKIEYHFYPGRNELIMYKRLIPDTP
jgi:serine/threonine-protein kinase RsbW